MTLLHTPAEAAAWLHAHVKGRLQTDSRKVRSGDGFIAWPGAATDGRHYVRAALRAGAKACLVEHEGLAAFELDHPAIASYVGLKAATGPLADVYYQSPSQALQTVAITGTNGKTSTAWWLAWALTRVGGPALGPAALVGTLGIGCPPELEYTGMTTPDPVLLQRRLRRFVKTGVQSCVMEASSIGIAEHRLDGIAIRVAAFTNFTQDHLDYHGTMDAYWAAKAQLFDWPGLQAAVINVDDPRGAWLVDQACGRGLDVWTVSIEQPTRLRATELSHGAHGLEWVLREGAHALPMAPRLIGEYNVSNMLGVIGVLRALGVPLEQAAAVCADLPAVPGRMECLDAPGAPLAVVDYAHTPDALDKALQSLRPLAAQRGGQLWCVFGCGGNRDASKRPLMGAAARRGAEAVVITSDNPRGEDPQAIVDAILPGLGRMEGVHVELDRARAINYAVQHAAASDVILVAGKGHESDQEVRGRRTPFSDQAQARRALEARRRSRRSRAS